MDDKKNMKYDPSRLLINPTASSASSSSANSQPSQANTQVPPTSAASLSITTQNIQRLGSLRQSPTTGDINLSQGLIPKDEKKPLTPRFVPKVPTSRPTKTPTSEGDSAASSSSNAHSAHYSSPKPTSTAKAGALAYIPKPRSQSQQQQRGAQKGINLTSPTSLTSPAGAKTVDLPSNSEEFWKQKRAEEEFKKKEIIEKQRDLFEGATNPPMILPVIDEVQKIEGDEFEFDEDFTLHLDEEMDENGEKIDGVKEEKMEIEPENQETSEKKGEAEKKEEEKEKITPTVIRNKEEDEEEAAALKDSIFKYNIEKLNSEDQMFFVQLPSFLPFASASGKDSADKKKTPVSMESALSSFSSMESNLSSVPQGKIGELQVHKSGKVKLKFGDVYFDVFPGSDFKIAENVIAVFSDSKKGFVLGEIANRICCVPDIDKILDLDKQN